jgi:hypothetical protein
MEAEALDTISHDDLESTVRDTSEGTRAKIVMATVASSPADQKTNLAKTAIDQLTPDQLVALRRETFPQESIDRRWVFVTGFIAAAVVALGVALIAWGASGESNGVANSVLVLGTGFTSAILGGLLGAYRGGGT